MIKEAVVNKASRNNSITTDLTFNENRNLSLMIHEDGDGTIWLHDVTSIKKSTRTVKAVRSNNTFKVCTIEAKDKNGKIIKFKLFT